MCARVCTRSVFQPLQLIISLIKPHAPNPTKKQKAHVKLRLVTPAAYETPAAAAATRLLVRVANDVLLPQAYVASLAGSHASLEAHEDGLTVALEGFPDVLPGLLERALGALCGAFRSDDDGGRGWFSEIASRLFF